MAYLFRKIELVFLTRTLLTVSSHSIWKKLEYYTKRNAWVWKNIHGDRRVK